VDLQLRLVRWVSGRPRSNLGSAPASGAGPYLQQTMALSAVVAAVGRQKASVDDWFTPTRWHET
jgi:hypothetical protein